MFSALVGHKAEFVRLLLENGLCLPQFLEHKETLCDLYKHLPSCLFLRKVAKRAQGSKRISLSHVAAEVRRLLGSFTQPLYHPTQSHKVEISSEDKELTVSNNEAKGSYISHYIPHSILHTFCSLKFYIIVLYCCKYTE